MELVREKSSWTIDGTCQGENFMDDTCNLLGRKLHGRYMELVWEKTSWMIHGTCLGENFMDDTWNLFGRKLCGR